MGNKKLSTDMARYIWSIIVKEPLLPMSWGVDLETVVCSEDALEFHVQGFLHTGNVRIVYIEGADVFQVLLYDEEGNLERYNIFSTRMLVRCDADGKFYQYDLVRTKKKNKRKK